MSVELEGDWLWLLQELLQLVDMQHTRGTVHVLTMKHQVEHGEEAERLNLWKQEVRVDFQLSGLHMIVDENQKLYVKLY